MDILTAAERIKKALSTKTRGSRGPNREREHVELFAGDLAEVCKQILAKKPDSVLGAHFLKAVDRLQDEQAVVCEADHIFALLDDL